MTVNLGPVPHHLELLTRNPLSVPQLEYILVLLCVTRYLLVGGESHHARHVKAKCVALYSETNES